MTVAVIASCWSSYERRNAFSVHNLCWIRLGQCEPIRIQCIVLRNYLLRKSAALDIEKERGGCMTRSRALNRFHRYLARRHRQDLRCKIPAFQPVLGGSETVDVSDRLMRRALQRDQQLEALEQEPAL